METNVSVGVLGHVDSGKTSLCKSLSTTGSTAAFDSNPQSIERGITLDLGFSSFKIDDKWNFTLVDCPGHASLIRTIIGGSQIMDIMLLVVDINKGMEVQTAECLILANLTTEHLIVVLNKVDMILEHERPQKIAKLTKLMKGALGKTKFKDVPIIPISAIDHSIGSDLLKDTLLQKVETMVLCRDTSSPFLMAIDHCFSKKGHGTVLTGTILQGRLKINDSIEISKIKEVRKVKSMQSFKIPIQEASAGDRIGICIPGLDSALVERTIISAPKFIHCGVRVAIISIQKIHFFKHPILSKIRRYHISIGYDTITAKLTLFKPVTSSSAPSSTYNPCDEHVYVERLDTDTHENVSQPGGVPDAPIFYAILEFDSLAMALPNRLVIGSDLQADLNCRLAFSGQMLDYSEDKNYITTFLPSIRILRWKEKVGRVDRIHGPDVLIVRGFSKRETSIEHLLNLKVRINLGVNGVAGSMGSLFGRIESRFGQTDKLRVQLRETINSEQNLFLTSNSSGATVHLRYATNYYRGGSQKKFYQCD